MSRPLTHRPFSELEPPAPEVTIIRRRTTDPETGLKLVRQIRATPLPADPPPNARLTPDPSEPEPPATKKRKVAGSEDREVAIARIAALQKAGESRKKAQIIVGKEMGFSQGAVNKWMVAASKASRVGDTEMAAKKKRARRGGTGEKIAIARANPDATAKELRVIAKKQGVTLSAQAAYNLRTQLKKELGKNRAPKNNGATASAEPARRELASNGAMSMGFLVAQAKSALEEIERRLSQLAL
jgi:transposase